VCNTKIGLVDQIAILKPVSLQKSIQYLHTKILVQRIIPDDKTINDRVIA